MLTPRASASTSSGWAYSRSIRSRTRRNSARSRRCCDEADLLVTTRSCHVSRQAREPHTVAHTRGSDAGGNASPGAACLAGGGGLDEDVDGEDYVTLSIRLLGPPALERDGRSVAAPRGRKAWAVLAYLLLAERPPGRRQLAELLFGDADDPLGALRWTLAELRRALGASALFGGDPVATGLGPGLEVDVRALTEESGEPDTLPRLLALGGELLEGLSVAASPAFESWLVVERHRVAGVVEARLRQVAMRLLAAGRAEEAVAYASRAVARNPLEEGNHELLVRSLAAAGDREAALKQVAVGEDTLRRELGVEPSAALRDA